MTQPAISDLERDLAIALHRGDTNACVAELRRSQLVLPVPADVRQSAEPVPWFTVDMADGVTAIAAFTSVELMQDVSRGALVHGRLSSMAQLAACWPDNRWILVINPGTPLQFEFEAGFLGRLAAPDLDMQEAATPELPIPIVQKVLLADQVADFFAAPDPTVSGFIHKAVDLEPFETPIDILDAVGLPARRYLSESGSISLVRWLAMGAALYPVSLGGRTPEQRDASGGWIVDAAPYVGLGFAPNPDTVVQEYHVTAVPLPHAAELGELDRSGSYHRVARYDAVRRSWLPIVPADPESLPKDVRAEILHDQLDYLMRVKDLDDRQ